MELLSRRIRSVVQEYKIGQVPKDILLNAIIQEVFHPSSFIYQYLDRFLNRLLSAPSKWICLSILSTISKGKKKVREISKDIKVSPTLISRHLKRLVKTGLVRKCGSMYLVSEPMLSLWLRLAYKTSVLSLGIGQSVYDLDIQKDLGRQLDIFEEEETKTVAQRLRQLFSSFKNDVVRLNGHRFKLPFFSEIEERLIKGVELPLVARVHNRYWIPYVAEKRANEKNVREAIEKFKKLHYRISCKPFICLDGIDTDAKLAAQEAGLAIWELEDINTLLDIYNQCPLIP
jgi:DNA-binding transcriptional ArsR family regulator